MKDRETKPTIIYGYFKDGQIDGEAWEIPFNAEERTEKALKTWSFEEQTASSNVRSKGIMT